MKPFDALLFFSAVFAVQPAPSDADYGTEGPLTTMTVDPQAGTMTVVPGTDASFFFAKFVSPF
jgi:hypothetical protein